MAAPQIPNLLSLRGASACGSRSSRPGGRPGDGRAGLSSSSQRRPDSTGSSDKSTTLSRATPSARADLAVQATDADAAISRLSAVSLGYLDDAFAEAFLVGGSSNGGGGSTGSRSTRRLPIINRGTYVRTRAVDRLVEEFLKGDDEDAVVRGDNERQATNGMTRQIVSLGAGSDTRYWRLRQQNKHQRLLFHEIDFPEVCEQKRRTVASSPMLLGPQTLSTVDSTRSTSLDGERTTTAMTWCLRNKEDTSHDTSSVQYICHACDLRTLAPDDAVQAPTPSTTTTPDSPTPSSTLPAIPHLRPDLPTLLISECCLCYLPAATAEAVLDAFTQHVPRLGIVLYEPVGPDDAFGQMMTENLAARGIVMPTVQRYRTLEAQVRRLREAGFGGGGREETDAGAAGGGAGGGQMTAATDVFNGARRARAGFLTCLGTAQAVDVERVWEDWITEEERERVDAIEGLDEVEEWKLLARHYAVVWGWRDVTGT